MVWRVSELPPVLFVWHPPHPWLVTWGPCPPAPGCHRPLQVELVFSYLVPCPFLCLCPLLACCLQALHGGLLRDPHGFCQAVFPLPELLSSPAQHKSMYWSWSIQRYQKQTMTPPWTALSPHPHPHHHVFHHIVHPLAPVTRQMINNTNKSCRNIQGGSQHAHDPASSDLSTDAIPIINGFASCPAFKYMFACNPHRLLRPELKSSEWLRLTLAACLRSEGHSVWTSWARRGSAVFYKYILMNICFIQVTWSGSSISNNGRVSCWSGWTNSSCTFTTQAVQHATNMWIILQAHASPSSPLGNLPSSANPTKHVGLHFLMQSIKLFSTRTVWEVLLICQSSLNIRFQAGFHITCKPCSRHYQYKIIMFFSLEPKTFQPSSPSRSRACLMVFLMTMTVFFLPAK